MHIYIFIYKKFAYTHIPHNFYYYHCPLKCDANECKLLLSSKHNKINRTNKLSEAVNAACTERTNTFVNKYKILSKLQNSHYLKFFYPFLPIQTPLGMWILVKQAM